jgi:hypothetical protein
MADPALQALLDPDVTGTGLVIERRLGGASDTLSHYYVVGNALGRGQSRWVTVTTADTDAQKNTAIRAAFGL